MGTKGGHPPRIVNNNHSDGTLMIVVTSVMLETISGLASNSTEIIAMVAAVGMDADTIITVLNVGFGCNSNVIA